MLYLAILNYYLYCITELGVSQVILFLQMIKYVIYETIYVLNVQKQQITFYTNSGQVSFFLFFSATEGYHTSKLQQLEDNLKDIYILKIPWTYTYLVIDIKTNRMYINSFISVYFNQNSNYVDQNILFIKEKNINRN